MKLNRYVIYSEDDQQTFISVHGVFTKDELTEIVKKANEIESDGSDKKYDDQNIRDLFDRRLLGC